MITFSYTKPSRVNRRRKRKWRNVTLADLIKAGLTDCYGLAHNVPAVRALAAGCRNPFSIGVQSPIIKSVFLCPKISRLLAKLSHYFMVGLSGQRLALAAPYARFPTPFKPATNAVGSIDGGYSILCIGSPL